MIGVNQCQMRQFLCIETYIALIKLSGVMVAGRHETSILVAGLYQLRLVQTM